MQINKRTFSLLPLLLFFSCASRVPVIEVPEPTTVIEIPPKEDYLTIIAVGDNLYHTVMIGDGEDGDYETAYSEISPLVKAADIAFINQETLLAGEDFGFSGYPLFNTPQKLGKALSLTGFNVVSHATNHVMDKGEKAILATLDFWDTIPEVSVLGIHRTAEQRDTPVLISKNNITVGFLSYTYGTNGIPVPANKPYLVSLVNTEIMAKEIDALRPLCDFLVVSMHWGDEYRHDSSAAQKNLAAFLADHGVDLVIGHHPHVIQAIEYIERPDGKKMICYFSLGNLISAHAGTQSATLLGAMAFVEIKKTAGTVTVTENGAIPLVTHFEKNYSNLKIYPINNYTEELMEKHLYNQGGNKLTVTYLSDLFTKIFDNKR